MFLLVSQLSCLRPRLELECLVAVTLVEYTWEQGHAQGKCSQKQCNNLSDLLPIVTQKRALCQAVVNAQDG